MKKMKFVVSTLTLSLTIGMGCAQAFGLGDALSVAGVGGSNATTNNGNANDLIVNTSTALIAFTKAQTDLADALGGYEELSNQRKQVANLKTGDMSGITDTMQTAVKISKSANDYLNQKMAAGAPLDAAQKKKAAKAMIGYVQGLVSSKKMISSIQDVARNPLSLGQNAGAALYMVKELPGIITGGVNTTGSLFKYLAANGVDTSAAQKVADGMGK